jgi:hypothetical protein
MFIYFTIQKSLSRKYVSVHGQIITERKLIQLIIADLKWIQIFSRLPFRCTEVKTECVSNYTIGPTSCLKIRQIGIFQLVMLSGLKLDQPENGLQGILRRPFSELPEYVTWRCNSRLHKYCTSAFHKQAK